MDPCLNLSYLSKNTLDGLILGNKMKTKLIYLSEPKWGTTVLFYFTGITAEQYVKKHAIQNKTLFLCDPYFPTRFDLCKDYAAAGHSMIDCFEYKKGMFDGWMKLEDGDWSHIWSTYGGVRLIIALSAVGLITLTGVKGN